MENWDSSSLIGFMVPIVIILVVIFLTSRKTGKKSKDNDRFS